MSSAAKRNIEYITLLVDNALVVKQKTKVWIRSILGIAVMTTLIFVSSGRLDYWQGWVYFGINLAIVALTTWILRNDPGLIAERLNPGEGTKIWDKGYFLLSTPLYFAAVILAGIPIVRGRLEHAARPVLRRRLSGFGVA